MAVVPQVPCVTFCCTVVALVEPTFETCNCSSLVSSSDAMDVEVQAKVTKLSDTANVVLKLRVYESV